MWLPTVRQDFMLGISGYDIGFDASESFLVSDGGEMGSVKTQQCRYELICSC